MALNYPGPYVLKLVYSVNGTPGGVLEHKAAYNIDLTADPAVGTPFNSIVAVTSASGTHNLQAWCDAWLGKIDFLYNDDATGFLEWQLWKAQTASFVLDYRSSYTPSHTWDVTTGVREASQLNMSFRTQEGGIMFLNLLDTIYDPDIPVAYDDMDTNLQAIADYVLLTSANILLGRDTSYPNAVIKAQTSQNDAVFRRRYR